MPWLVSMRMMGQVIGARPTVRTRRSVIWRAEGLELVLVFCGRASRVWSAQRPAVVRAAARLRKDRRGCIKAPPVGRPILAAARLYSRACWGLKTPEGVAKVAPGPAG